MLSALAFHQCGPGSNLGVNAIIMWVEFVVASLLCFKKLYSGYSYPQEPAFINPNSTRNGKKKRTTMWMRYLKITIHSFIYLLISVAQLIYFWSIYISVRNGFFCGRKGTLQPLELLEIWSCLHNIIQCSLSYCIVDDIVIIMIIIIIIIIMVLLQCCSRVSPMSSSIPKKNSNTSLYIL